MLSSTSLVAQKSYNTAIGLRAGGTSGLTVKQFIGSSHAIEGIIGFWPNAFSITATYQKYTSSGSVTGLNWYYGGGAHVAIETDPTYHYDKNRGRWYYYRYHDEGVGIGIDGIIGLEYKIPAIPFAISLDLKPFLEVGSYGGVFAALDPGLGIKVAF